MLSAFSPSNLLPPANIFYLVCHDKQEVARLKSEFAASQTSHDARRHELDLRTVWSRPEGDPAFTLDPDASVETLVAYWRRMVDVAFESGAGIIHVRVNAFTPQDAQTIASAILAQSSALVNRLSEQAREDAVRFAREELAEAEDALRAMRQRLADFRSANRIVDPSADVAGQMGLLNALQSELAQALVERDMLLSFVGEDDQRVIQAKRRIDAITARIDAERASLGVPGAGAGLFLDLSFCLCAFICASCSSIASCSSRRVALRSSMMTPTRMRDK